MNPHFDTFKIRAEAVNAEVHRFATRLDALQFILQVLKQEGVADAAQSYAVWADAMSPDGRQDSGRTASMLAGVSKQQLSEQVPGLRFDVTRALAAEAKIGISEFDWAIANTGTLVQDATAVEKRLVSTLPIVHIAVAGTDAIVPDLPSLLAHASPRQTNYLAFITGPSRTADIERVLTIGVHGPERLVIVFVDEIGRAN
jgi:L-lactate dehydrogenase complex protein LldG